MDKQNSTFFAEKQIYFLFFIFSEFEKQNKRKNKPCTTNSIKLIWDLPNNEKIKFVIKNMGENKISNETFHKRFFLVIT